MFLIWGTDFIFALSFNLHIFFEVNYSCCVSPPPPHTHTLGLWKCINLHSYVQMNNHVFIAISECIYQSLLAMTFSNAVFDYYVSKHQFCAVQDIIF